MNTNLIVRCCLIGLVTTSAGCLGDESIEDEPSELVHDDSTSAPTLSYEGADAGKPAHKDGGPIPPPRTGDEDDEAIESDEDCWTDAPSAKDAGAPFPLDAGKAVEPRDGGKGDTGKGAPRSDGGATPDASAPDKAVCSGRGIGFPNECLSYVEAEQRLAVECARDGLELVEVTQKGDPECAPGTSHQAWGTCCLQQPPEQAPDDCFVEAVTQPVCSHAELYNQLAEDQCSTRGNFYVPYLIARDDECQDGFFLSAEYWCCPDS